MKKNLLALVSVSLFTGIFGQSSVALNPSKDNSIYSESSNSNALGELYVGVDCSFNPRRALIYFDIAGAIPSGSTITSVTLALNMDFSDISPFTLDYSLYTLLQDWGEGTSSGTSTGAAPTANDATWTDALFGSTTWSTPGGDYTPGAVATTSIPPITGTYNWSSAGMVTDVQNWLDAPAANFGWMLIGDETTTNCVNRVFGSKDAGIAPVLTIEYKHG